MKIAILGVGEQGRKVSTVNFPVWPVPGLSVKALQQLENDINLKTNIDMNAKEVQANTGAGDLQTMVERQQKEPYARKFLGLIIRKGNQGEGNVGNPERGKLRRYLKGAHLSRFISSEAYNQILEAGHTREGSVMGGMKHGQGNLPLRDIQRRAATEEKQAEDRKIRRVRTEKVKADRAKRKSAKVSKKSDRATPKFKI